MFQLLHYEEAKRRLRLTFKKSTLNIFSFFAKLVSTKKTYTSVTRWWNKQLPNFYQYCPKSRRIIFYVKVVLFKIAQTFSKIIGLFLKENLWPKEHPIWSHCLLQQFESLNVTGADDVALTQCDLVRLFFNIWPFGTFKISTIMSLICPSTLSILPTKKLTGKNLPNLVTLLWLQISDFSRAANLIS